MSQLPVIVGFGGISPAGRTSFHHGYRRLILDQLDSEGRQETIVQLATTMGLASYEDGLYVTNDGARLDASALAEMMEQTVCDNTLIRRIHPDWFDVDNILFNRPATLKSHAAPLSFKLRRRHLPKQIPENWIITDNGGDEVQISLEGHCEVIFPDSKEAPVQSAGMLPTGFHPNELYQSRNHPRGIQMSIYAASDALRSVGIDFEEIRARIRPDQIGVFASNSIGQLDDLGFGGLTKYPTLGKRTTSKQMPLGYAQMPADFVNAYLLGNVGSTSGALGACATFLYNLKHGVDAIRSGQIQMAMIGGSDAPVTPEIIEGFRAMGALVEDHQLAELEGVDELTAEHYRRACRPFGVNKGFTIGESSQFLILMSDELALEIGADIHGAVPDVFVNADGHKKSISAPGVGNYITMAKSAALIRSMLGEESLRQRSYVQAHGTSTPQNRTTESHVINETAKAFGIQNWPLAAIKAYFGHSQGTCGGDQIAVSLGVWHDGIIPGLVTTPAVADDVFTSNLTIPLQHMEVGRQAMDSVIINAKGFGGNNASACVLAPHICEQMLGQRYSSEQISEWKRKREQTRDNARRYDLEATRGLSRPIYRYDDNVLAGEDLQMSAHSVSLPGYAKAVDLDLDNPFSDMC